MSLVEKFSRTGEIAMTGLYLTWINDMPVVETHAPFGTVIAIRPATESDFDAVMDGRMRKYDQPESRAMWDRLAAIGG